MFFFSDTNNFIALYVLAVVVFMALAPMLMLIQSKNLEKPRLRFVFIGVTELIVILLFIGMMFPRL
jgi:hypothetical protein